MDVWDFYRCYLAVKLHFTTDYDVFKYSGKVQASREAMTARKDFSRMVAVSAKLKDTKEAIGFLLSNFTEGDPGGGLYETQANKRYLEWQKRNQSLSYTFKKELGALELKYTGDQLFECNPSELPYIVQEHIAGNVCLETMVLLNEIRPFLDEYDRELAFDKLIWPTLSKRIRKYTPFMRITNAKREKYGSIYREVYGSPSEGTGKEPVVPST